MHHSSPASHSEYYRPKLAVSYLRSRISEIEYNHHLDAFLYLAGSFDHTRPLSEVEYYHSDKAVSHHSTHGSEFEYYRSVEAVLCHISRVPVLGYYHPEEAGLFQSSPNHTPNIAIPSWWIRIVATHFGVVIGAPILAS